VVKSTVDGRFPAGELICRAPGLFATSTFLGGGEAHSHIEQRFDNRIEVVLPARILNGLSKCLRYRGPGGVGCSVAELLRRLIRRSSANRPSGKFALMEFSEIRLRQDSYFWLYEP